MQTNSTCIVIQFQPSVRFVNILGRNVILFYSQNTYHVVQEVAHRNRQSVITKTVNY